MAADTAATARRPAANTVDPEESGFRKAARQPIGRAALLLLPASGRFAQGGQFFGHLGGSV